MIIVASGSGLFRAEHDPDLGFIRDVGKDGWIVPSIDQVIGGVRNADMIQVNSSNVVVGLSIDDGPWEVRIGLVGETTGTTVEIVSAKPTTTYTMVVCQYNYYVDSEGFGGFMYYGIRFPVDYVAKRFRWAANRAYSDPFEISTFPAAAQYVSQPMGQYSYGISSPANWTQVSKYAWGLTATSNAWVGSLMEELPRVEEMFYGPACDVTPSPVDLLLAAKVYGFDNAADADMNSVLESAVNSLGGMVADAYIDAMNAQSIYFYGPNQTIREDAGVLQYREFYAGRAIPGAANYRNLSIGGPNRKADGPKLKYQEPLPVAQGTIGWRVQPRPAAGKIVTGGYDSEPWPLEGMAIIGGTSGIKVLNQDVGQMKRQIALNIRTPFKQDRIQVLIRRRG